MKPVRKLYKAIMCLNPGALLSSASKEKCIANLSELPSINVRGGKPKRRASVLVPICVDKGEVCILYTLRSINLSSHSGQVAFPGGKIDENETVYDAAIRETEEEIGVPAKDIEIWAKMSEIQGRDANMLITPVVGEIKNFDMGKLKPNADEVSDIFTIPMKVFCDPENHDLKRSRGWTASPNILEADTQDLYEASVVTKQAATNNSKCKDCEKYNSSDNRNEHFSQLLCEEFRYIQPCIRTSCFIKILKFLDEAKHNHCHEIDIINTQQ